MPRVIKVDGRREPFDRNKLERGLHFAFAKRPVSQADIKILAEEIEREVGELGVAEIPSRAIGERVLPRLRAVDQVAYVRFASIYRDFRDLDGFAKELDALKSHPPGIQSKTQSGIEAETDSGSAARLLHNVASAAISGEDELRLSRPKGCASNETS